MDYQTAVVANASRLLRDAKLLLDSERYASSFALAVLALEEIGKLIIGIWTPVRPELPKSQLTSHVRKQSAVAALLLAQHTVKTFGGPMGEAPPTDEHVERVARSMFESSAGKLSRLVHIGAVDKAKQLAFYHDEWFVAADLHSDQFTASDVEQVFDSCRSAIAAVGDPQTMRVGRAIYDVSLRARSSSK